MANLPENSDFEAGVYQIELTDEVVGGADGISNRQGRQLANRTRWLKDQVDILNNLKGKTIPAFSIANSYLAGEIVSHLKNIWRANTNVSPGAFNPSQWTKLLGTAAEADRMATASDTTAGALMVLGALGWGGNSLNNTESADNYTIGSFMGIDASESASVALNLPALGGVGTSARGWRVLTFGGSTRTVQIAVEVFGVGTVRGRSFKRVKHDSTWYPWIEDATLASPAFTGNPTAPTAPQFDNDTSLANTAFVQRALGNHQAFEQITANRTLTAADAGKVFLVTANCTITLPDSTTLPSGTKFTILNSGSITATLAGPQVFSDSGKIVTFLNGFSGELFPRQDTNQYRVSMSGDGAASLAASGYQVFQSGMIMQWGYSSSWSAVVFPIAFPTTTVSVISTPVFPTQHEHGVSNVTRTGFSPSTNGATSPFYYIALGY